MRSIATRLAAASLLLAAVAACATGASAPSPSPAANPTPTPVTGGSAAPSAAPTQVAPVGQAVPIKAAAAEPQACMDALLTGTLAPNNLSGLGVTSPDGQATAVEWPFGYTGMLTEGKLVLLDETGTLVAQVGDEISVGGGFGNQFWHSCAPVTKAP